MRIKSKVTLGDGNVQTVEGKDTIAVKIQNGSQKYIHDVFYVPGLTQNLLSVGQLIQKNYKVIFDDDKCNIIDKRKGQIISIKMAPNKVFPLFMPFGQNNALKCENMDESILWHLRYGHLNFNGLKLLKQKKIWFLGFLLFHLTLKFVKAAFMARCTGYHFQKHLGELKLHFNWCMLISGDHQVPPALVEEDIFSSSLMTTLE